MRICASCKCDSVVLDARRGYLSVILKLGVEASFVGMEKVKWNFMEDGGGDGDGDGDRDGDGDGDGDGDTIVCCGRVTRDSR